MFLFVFKAVHQTDFQQNLRDHFAADINIIRNVDSFIADCKTFFSKDENFIKALQSTEVKQQYLASHFHICNFYLHQEPRYIYRISCHTLNSTPGFSYSFAFKH
jgi:hypothetical protein